jgi:hypothetical protein
MLIKERQVKTITAECPELAEKYKEKALVLVIQRGHSTR